MLLAGDQLGLFDDGDAPDDDLAGDDDIAALELADARPMVAVPMGERETDEDDEPVGAVIGAT